MTLRRLLPKKNDAGAAMAFLRRPRGAISCCIGTSESAAASSGAHIRPSREAMLERMANEEFDLVIVGGGATGCGAALDAASRGLKVAMVERADFGAGTSARRWVCMKMCLFSPLSNRMFSNESACLPACLQCFCRVSCSFIPLALSSSPLTTMNSIAPNCSGLEVGTSSTPW